MIKELHFPEPDTVFTPVFHALNEAKTRFVLNKGGTGSSKSFSAAQKEVLIAIEEPVNTLIIRKVASTLRDSVIPSFKRRITEFDLWEVFTENKSERTITCTATGSQFIFRGLDDPEKMKSIEGIKRILIEEGTELTIEDFFELNRRARGYENIQITINFNPIHEKHWLKLHFFDQEIEDCTIIHSTYKDNPFLTEVDAKQIEYLRDYHYNQYRVYALGEWGLTENGNPWLFAFNQDKHVKEVKFNPTFPVYLSFDFNVEPVSCLVFQMTPAQGYATSFIYCIDEIVLNAQLDELCRHIKSKYPISIMYVTGDAAGNARNVGFEQRHMSYYKMIQSYLNIPEKLCNVPTKNMEHNDSRNLCNTMLYNYPNFYISPNCKKLLTDIQVATVDETKAKAGVLKKDRDVYKMDVFDCFRYFLQTYFSQYVEDVYFSGKVRA